MPSSKFRRRYYAEIYSDQKKEWRWRVKSRNGRIVADSAEGYKNETHAVKMVKAVCRVREVRFVDTT